ncbi:MAG: aconitate hydratase AcnA [Acidobacteriota bacterium]|nr:aconitate hydratase AcnA [Acidobacteriota bacterium]
MQSLDSFGVCSTLEINGEELKYFKLTSQEKGFGSVEHLPFSLKILLENLLRHEDGEMVTADDIQAVVNWEPTETPCREIAFKPARVILQDFTGVPALVDLAVMRDAIEDMGGDPASINPQIPSDLVIDHSVQIDSFGTAESFRINVDREFERNLERYTFLRWGQSAFDNLRVVPPATGIVHQVNLEYLAQVVFRSEQEDGLVIYPDTLVGTDSHTTMINGLGVLGWGVGGIEAEAAMLGQPISLLIPQVLGFKLVGKLPEGTTSTDLVLTITQMLRQKGVVGQFVEFYGSGLSSLSLEDRATIGNMAPEYGSTCAIFPIDERTIEYLKFTSRSSEHVTLVESYAKEQGLFHISDSSPAAYSSTMELDLGTVETSLAGPKRPQDRVPLSQSKALFNNALSEMKQDRPYVSVPFINDNDEPIEAKLGHGTVVIAAITSCTHTSNPKAMIGAGLLAKNAVKYGLQSRPWVKTSLAPGSKVVTEYLEAGGLLDYLSQLGFHLVGYGCTTCIGNSGPLPGPILSVIEDNGLVVCSVLSGNRNFEGRISPHVQANYLASPPLVVAYALAGKMDIDLYHEPLGQGRHGQDVYLRDIWPSEDEVLQITRKTVTSELFSRKYADIFTGNKIWRNLHVPSGNRFVWDNQSTYIRQPPFFKGMPREPLPVRNIQGMKIVAMLGDSVTTDHISPAGSIPEDGSAGKYLIDHGVEPTDFNSFGSRRGNHEVMMRGTFGNIRLRNLLVPGTEGGYTLHPSSSKPLTIYDAAVRYRKSNEPLLVVAGKEYGSGSSRDWAAKGARLLGIKAVLAESYERIHRSNLIGMGVLPLQFLEGEDRKSLRLTGSETCDLLGLEGGLEPRQELALRVSADDGSVRQFSVLCRIDTSNEANYYRHGGILHYVLRSLL